MSCHGDSAVRVPAARGNRSFVTPPLLSLFLSDVFFFVFCPDFPPSLPLLLAPHSPSPSHPTVPLLPNVPWGLVEGCWGVAVGFCPPSKQNLHTVVSHLIDGRLQGNNPRKPPFPKCAHIHLPPLTFFLNGVFFTWANTHSP